MKTRLWFLTIFLFSATFSFGIQGYPGNQDSNSESRHGNIFSNYSPPGSHVGIFQSYGGGRGYWNNSYDSQGSAYHRMGRSRDNYRNYYGNYSSHYAPYSLFMGNPGWGRSRYWQKSLYSSDNFVQEWKNKDPAEKGGSDLEDSPLLSRGMTEEEVVFALGTPLRRIRFEGREIWKYSSFSLVFDNGVLTELR